MFGDLYIFLFVRKCRLNWIGHIIAADSKRKVIQIFNNNPHGIRLTGDQKTDGGTVYKHILIVAK